MSRESLGAIQKAGLKEKIKGIFQKKDSTSDNPSLANQSASSRKSSPAIQSFSLEKLRALGPKNEPAARVKELEKLSVIIADSNLDVVSLWETIKDLLEPKVLSPRKQEDVDLRAEILKFLILMTSKQYNKLDTMRGILFHAICDQYQLCLSDEGSTEEMAPIFDWLSALTNVGKNVTGFEEYIGDLLVKWTEEFLLARPESPRVFIPDWLEFLANIFSTNSAFLEVAAGPIVQYLCELTGRTERNEETEGCLAVLDCLIGFSIFPENQMFLLMTTLCRLANDERLCQKCWALMRSTFSSYEGYKAMNTLLKILQTVMDPGKLRGAVFFVGMGLWGSQKVSSLYYSPTAALPSLKCALVVDSNIVTHEILISLERLVRKYGKDLQLLTWQHILAILDEVLETSSMSEVDIRNRFNIVLDVVENLSDANRFGGSAEQLFALVEKCSKQRSEESILRLLTYRAQAINPLRGGWVKDLRKLMTLYYRNDARASIRMKAVDILRNVYTLQKQLYGDEIVEHVVIPLMSDLEKEKDSEVQGKALHFLCDIAKTLQQQGCGILSTIKTASSGEGVKNTTDFFFEIIGILERVINGSLDVVKRKNALRVLSKRKSTLSTDGEDNSAPEFSIDDDAASEISVSLSERATEYLNNVEMGVDIIVEILKATWRGQASHVFHMLKVLASHVLLEYHNGINDSIAGATRHAILKLILKIRAHPVTFRLGHLFGEKQPQIEYSPYASVYDPDDPEDPDEDNPEQSSFFKWNLCAQVVITCLQKERFWPVLKDVFNHLPALLHNRNLVLSTRASIPALGSALLAMVDDPQRIQILIGAPDHFTSSDLAELICPSLAALVTYKDCFQEALQRKLVIGIQGALNSERSFEAVLATVSCILEMPTTVLPMTRDLVRRLKEIKMVARIAIPIVELLSTLLRLPKLYEQFSEKDFRNVLKSLTPCTRVAQYNSFIVSVAHHIIYRWMLKTPLNLRPALAKHILSAIEDANSPLIGKKSSGSENRSPNLSVEPSLTPSSSTETNSDYFANIAADLHILMSEFFHHFTYTNSPADPGKPTMLSELLAKEGWTKNWVVGNRIITVSTIINRSPAGRMGSGDVSNNCEIKFCAKCNDWLQNRYAAGSASSIKETEPNLSSAHFSVAEEDFSAKRKRHASAANAQTRVTRRPSGATKVSLDDTAINRVQRYGGSQDLRFNFATPSPNTSFQAKGGLPLCGCWCRGFATVEIQHAFGKTLWLTQISGTQLKEIDLGGNNGAIERWAMIRIQEGGYWDTLPNSPFLTPEDHRSALRTRHRSSSESPVPPRMLRNYSDGTLGDDAAVRDPLEERANGHTQEKWPSRTSLIAARSISLHESRTEPGSRQDISSPLTIDVSHKSQVDFADTPASSHSGSTYLSARSEALSRARAAANSEFGILAQDYSQVDPAWVFNQLCCQGFSENDKDVILLPDSEKEAISRSLRILDKKPPFEMHKIGVVYAGLRQTSEAELLGNQFGSERYNRFLSGLGSLVSLRRANQARTFLGGLDTNGKDGQFTYHWQDPITQVLFHVATLMPNREKDPKFQQKKRHIGNDFVIIVYNESGVEYKLGTVSGQYAYVAIVVTPVDEDTVAVKLLAKDEISRWLSIKELVVSNQEAPLLCRQIAMRAEFSAVVWQSQSQRDQQETPYISRYMERLKHIHRIREKYAALQ